MSFSAPFCLILITKLLGVNLMQLLFNYFLRVFLRCLYWHGRISVYTFVVGWSEVTMSWVPSKSRKAWNVVPHNYCERYRNYGIHSCSWRMSSPSTYFPKELYETAVLNRYTSLAFGVFVYQASSVQHIHKHTM